MALKTSGSTLSTLAHAPAIPGNVGKIDAASIYDRVVQGLQTAEALRQAAGQQRQVNAELQAATEAAPMRTAILAQQAEQAPIQTALLADKAALSGATLPGTVLATNAGLDADLATEQNRREGERAKGAALAGMAPAQRVVFDRFGPASTGTALTTRLPNGDVSTETSKGYQVGNEVVPVSNQTTQGPFALLPGVPSDLRAFEQIISTLSPEEQALARKIRAKVEAPAAATPFQLTDIPQGDGSTIKANYNRATGETTAINAPGGTPARSQSTTEKQSDQTRATETEKLKVEKQANFPKAQQAIRDWDANSANVISTLNDVATAIDHLKPTGVLRKIAARVPGTDEYNTEQAIKTALANVAFDKLSAIRATSKTGGALGNVTDKDMASLQASIASLDLGQDKEKLKANINKIVERYTQMNSSQRQAYEQEYADLINPAASPATAPQTAAAPAPIDQEAVNWARANSADPRARAIFEANGISN